MTVGKGKGAVSMELWDRLRGRKKQAAATSRINPLVVPGPPESGVLPSSDPPPASSGDPAPATSFGAPADGPVRREIRVFISSTFRDMMQERDLLVKVVFPALRRKCAGRFVTFTEVDLRWGITEEQANGGQVLPLCLAEIQRCRPYFLGLLGERYGWVPDSIRAGLIEQEPWLHEHVVGRTSVTELEILHGALNNPAMKNRVFFYFRDPAYATAPSLSPDKRGEMVEHNMRSEVERYGEAEATRRTEERRAKLAALKQRIRDSELPLIEPYATPEDLAKIVERQFDTMIDQLYPEAATPDQVTQERLSHEAHARSKLFACIDRPAHMGAINAFGSTADHEGRGLVITGESGVGKTTILAAWARGWAKCHSDHYLFQHYFGATPQSSSPEGFLARLLSELKDRYGIADGVPTDPEKLREALPLWLAQTAGKGRIALVLDGLDQVQGSEADRCLFFLPRRFPPHVTIIASALPGPALATLRERKWMEHDLPLASEAEIDAMMREYLSIYARTLDVHLRAQLVAAAGPRNPLFLRTVLEELRQVGCFDVLPAQVARYLEADNPRELFLRVIERWQADFDGKDAEKDEQTIDLVRRALTTLWAARQGLSEPEWLDLLGDQNGPLPRALWTPLFFALEPHLSRRESLYVYGHSFLRQAVEARFLTSPGSQHAVHVAVADYFEHHPAQKGMTPRKAAEWPHQLFTAEAWDRLEACLTDIPLFLALYNDTTKWELTAYWHPLRRAGRHMGDCYTAAYRHFIDKAAHAHNRDLPNRLGGFLLENGLYPAAEPLLRRALEAYHQGLGESHPSTLNTAHNLALLFDRTDRMTEAEGLYRHILAIRKTTPTSDIAGELSTSSALATLLSRKGDHAGAAELHGDALSVSARLYGTQHPVHLVLLDNYANCLSRMGRYHDAQSLCRQVHEGLSVLKGPGHPDTLIALNNLLGVSLQLRDTTAASGLIEQLFLSIDSIVGEQHPMSLTALDNVATLLSRTGDLDRADVLRRRALRASEDVLGPEHTVTVAIRKNLATLLARQGKEDEAETLTRDCLATMKRLSGAQHPSTLMCLEDLAILLENRGNVAEADHYYKLALKGRIKTLPPGHPDLVSVIRNYFDLLRKTGLDESAALNTVEREDPELFADLVRWLRAQQ